MLASGTRAEDQYLAAKKAADNAPFDALQAALAGKTPDEIRAALPGLLLNNPSTFAAGAEMMMKAPAEQWADATQHGIPGQASSTTHEFKPYPVTAANNPTPYTDPAKIAADVKAGFISPEQGQAAMAALTAGKATPTLTDIQGPDGNTVKAWVYPDGRPPVIAGQAPDNSRQEPPSPLGKLINERNAAFKANPNDPNIKVYDQAISRQATGEKGLSVIMNDDGTVSSITQGGGVDATPAEQQQRIKGQVKMFGDMAADFPAADAFYQSVGALSSALNSTDTGAWPNFVEGVRKATGIALAPNAGKLQAINSMVDYLTPRMRVAGSGSTSDIEMAAFRNALPTLAGTPEGNALISTTLQKLGLRRLSMAKIAQDYTSGLVDAKTAIQQLREMPDAFDAFKAATQQAGPTVIDGVTIEKVE